jgi:hypothetical protein
MKGAILAGLIALALSACAADSGVVRMGSDTYMVSKQAATGFSGLGNLKADALKEAYAQCSQTGKSIQIVNSQESKPPYIFGNYPRVDITFRCVAQ